tara:strand:- start:1339 stop:1809 length:471 start_codon:yes stop_codon:yes gene_type:complete
MQSPLSRDECIKRLRESVGSQQIAESNKTVIGTYGENSFEIRKAISYRNRFQTVLKASFAETSNGTQLKCRLGISTLASLTLTGWLLAPVAVLLILLIFNDRSESVTRIQDVLLSFVPLGMLVFIITLTVRGLFLAKGEVPFLLKFLETTIGAKRV